MAEHGDFDVSDDGQTASATFTVAPYGVYDAEKQLNSQQIIDMKQLFKNEHGHPGSFASRIVARIALDLTMGSAFLRPDNEDEYLELEDFEAMDPEEPIEGMSVGDLLELVGRAASIAASWQEGLDVEIALPGDAWHEGRTPPATFAQGLLSEELRRVKASNYSYNLDGFRDHITEQVRLYESVTGVRLEVEGLNNEGSVKVIDESLKQEEINRLKEASETVLYDGEVIVTYKPDAEVRTYPAGATPVEAEDA